MRLNKSKFLHRKSKGASLPIAAIASLVMLILALTAVQTASTSLETAQRKLREERCYELARSFALAIAKEIEEGRSGSLEKQGLEAVAGQSITNIYTVAYSAISPAPTANIATPGDVWIDRNGGSALYWFMRDFISGVPPVADMSEGKLKDNYKWLFDVPYEFSLQKKPDAAGATGWEELDLPDYGKITVTLKKHDKQNDKTITSASDSGESKTVSEISKDILTALNGAEYGQLNSSCSAMSYFDAMPYQSGRTITGAKDYLLPLFQKYAQTVPKDETYLSNKIDSLSSSADRYLLTIEVTAEYEGVKWTYPMEYNVSTASGKFTADSFNDHDDNNGARILFYFDSDGNQHFMLYVKNPSEFKLYDTDGYEKSFGEMLQAIYPHLYNHGVFTDGKGGGFLVHLGESDSSVLPFMHYYEGFKPVPMCMHEYNASLSADSMDRCPTDEITACDAYATDEGVDDTDACLSSFKNGVPEWNVCHTAVLGTTQHWLTDTTDTTFDCKQTDTGNLAFQIPGAARVYYVSINFDGTEYIAAMGEDVQMKFTPKYDILKRESD